MKIPESIVRAARDIHYEHLSLFEVERIIAAALAEYERLGFVLAPLKPIENMKTMGSLAVCDDKGGPWAIARMSPDEAEFVYRDMLEQRPRITG